MRPRPTPPPEAARILAAAAVALVPAGEPVFVQAAIARARSGRATHGAGYRPIGAEILFSAL